MIKLNSTERNTVLKILQETILSFLAKHLKPAVYRKINRFQKTGNSDTFSWVHEILDINMRNARKTGFTFYGSIVPQFVPAESILGALHPVH
jgi:hypothetical protein